MTQRFPMHTHTGQPVWFTQPHRTPVVVEDLRAHSIRICRYGGARSWELVRHLALCIALAEMTGASRTQLAAVALHDLHEAYVGDVVSPLKQVLPGFCALEAEWEAHVHAAFGVPYPLPDDLAAFVKTIDLRALAVELHGLKHHGRHYYPERPPESAMEHFFTVRHMALSACWARVAAALPSLEAPC